MCLKLSKHFLISIFFPCPTPRSCLEQWGPIFLQFCSYKYVLSISIYNIALQNTDFGVLQKSSKHFLISIFFQMGRGDTPLPDPPPARHFVPRTRASPLSMTIHAPPSTKSWIRHCQWHWLDILMLYIHGDDGEHNSKPILGLCIILITK